MKTDKKDTIDKIINTVLVSDPMSPPLNICKITAQDTIPVYACHEKQNLIETYPGFFTKSYYIGENNYQTETEDVEKIIFTKFRGILNSIGSNCEMGITIHNRNINMDDFKDRVLNKEQGDNLDDLRRELNKIILSRIQEGKNGIEKKKYITVGVHTDSLKKANATFIRLDRSLNSSFQKIQSYAKPIPMEERLEILHDIYNPDRAGEFLTRVKVTDKNGITHEKAIFDFDNMRAMGLGVKDMISPSSIQHFSNYMRLGRKYVRVMQITGLPNGLMDDFFVKLSDVDFNMLVTVNIRPIQTREANALVHKSIVLAQNAKSNEMKGLVAAGLPSEMVSPETEELVEKAKELRSDMINDDEKLFKTTYTLMVFADDMEELSDHTKSIIANCQSAVVTVKTMDDMQEEGFNTTLPLLDVEIPFHKRRTLKSSSLADVCMPFSNLELTDPDGINYSLNFITKNLILYNRLLTQNFNGFILGTPGSGKSFTAKTEMLNVILGSNADCIVIDPEDEYGALSKLIGGEIIKIEPGGKWHINPMEIVSEYQWTNENDTEETNPVLAKADFILKLMEVLVKTPFGLNSIQETIIDECVHQLYKPFMEGSSLKHIPPEMMPTLTDLQIVLSGRKEAEAKELSMALKLYTGNGSLNTFGFKSNVDVKNRFLVYNIKDIGDKLKPIAMLIILDSILNKLFENRKKGRNTWIWIDEIYLLFADERSASFLNMIFKRARKYGGVPTGITQNVEDLLESNTARKMLSNCNFIQMLNQAPNDRELLSQLLNLSGSQLDIITSAPKGQGLIYTGTSCVPFASTFPKTSPIYRVLTSNMAEIKEYEEEDRRKELARKKSEKKVDIVNSL
ncbi:MAG: DUF87 domain-containing protein [Butyrivibrio sp.]|nr:DUF87 domain-containing protein [Butyrivibrio sp.]